MIKKILISLFGFLALAGVALVGVAHAAGTTTIPWYTNNNTTISPYPIVGVNPPIIVNSTATSTFSNGINVTGGCVSVGGNCIGGNWFWFGNINFRYFSSYGWNYYYCWVNWLSNCFG